MDQETIDAIVAERLPPIDQTLAENGVSLAERPLQATFFFIDINVLALRYGDGREFKPGAPEEIVSEKWFAAIYQLVEDWYFNRYGNTINRRADRQAIGLLVMWSTAFRLNIPTTITCLTGDGETATLRFPDRVLEQENPLDWLTPTPSLDHLKSEELDELRSSAHRVSTRIRSISVSMLGIPGHDPVMAGLLSNVRTNLEHAARKALKENRFTLETAAWDLHLAVECGLKALSHRKTGSFAKTHNLSILKDAVQDHVTDFPSSALDHLPSDREAVDLRYGQGGRLSLGEFWTYYLAALEILDIAMDSLMVIGLGSAELLIAYPPWKRPLK